jgi:transposase
MSSNSAGVKYHELSIEDRYAIVALARYTNYNHNIIAEKIGCHRTTVDYTLRQYREHRSVENMPRSGRPPLVDITDINNNPITKLIREHRKSTSNSLQYMLEQEYNLNVSARTIRRLREQLGFRPVHYRRRPLLTEEQKKVRLQYALDHLDDDWMDIIFTDESWFEVGDHESLIYKHPHSPSIVKPTPKHKFKVMIWGGIWWDGRSKLHFVEGTIDAEYYQQILNECVIKPHLAEEKSVLQDGARPHIAQSTLEFVDEADITILQNPVNSPELNPIEKVWNWMKVEKNKRNPQTKDELIQIVQSIWDNMQQSTIQSYITHNSTVCCDLIESQGGIIMEPHRPHKH